MSSPYVTTWIIVSWFLGLYAVVSVLRQPSRAFVAAGHSKRFWLVLEVAGFVLSFTGILTWAVYMIWIRPGVVRAAGRKKRAVRLARAAARPRSAAGQVLSGSSSYSTPKASPCGTCGGRGEQTCFACQGRGRISSPAYASAAVGSDDWCSRCSGSGKRPCDSCGGRGTR